MERMAFQPELDTTIQVPALPAAAPGAGGWRQGLPTLRGSLVEYWGTGLFVDVARLAVDFAFDVLGAHRLEARAALNNFRGNAALRKVGATQEGVLRRSLLRDGEFLDQALWTIVADEWLRGRAPVTTRIVH